MRVKKESILEAVSFTKFQESRVCMAGLLVILSHCFLWMERRCNLYRGQRRESGQSTLNI